tara:strand:+ start:172 stop:396 length:225 start_codon:yes stop_codon:yes gene_type:complete
MKQKLLFNKLSILFDINESDVKQNLSLKNIHSLDSLKHMELISMIEKNAKRHLTSKEIAKLNKVSDIMKLLNVK